MRAFVWRFLAVVLVTSIVLIVTDVTGSTRHTADARPVYGPVVGSTADPTVAEVEAAWVPWSRDQVVQAILRYVEAVAFSDWLASLPPPSPPPPPTPVYTYRAPAPTVMPSSSPAPVQSAGSNGGFLDCVRNRESRGDYSIHNAGGSGASGAYQFMPGTWNSTAKASGRGDLVGMDPAAASPADQDAMARALYAQQGAAPWGGGC